MLGRLFLGLHWIFFIAFVAIGCLAVLTMIVNGTGSVLRGIWGMLGFDKDLWGFLFIGAITWIPPVFLFIDWVVTGKLTWFPWKRNN